MLSFAKVPAEDGCECQHRTISMIRKSVQRFSEKDHAQNNRLKRDGDSI
jgi:hypothetical protein